MLYIDPWPLGGVRPAGECWPIMFALDAWLCFGQLGGTGPWETFTRPPVWRHTGQSLEEMFWMVCHFQPHPHDFAYESYDVLKSAYVGMHLSWASQVTSGERKGTAGGALLIVFRAVRDLQYLFRMWNKKTVPWCCIFDHGKKGVKQKNIRIRPCNCSLAFYRCHWPSWGWCNRGVLARHCYEVTTNGREFTSWGTRSLVAARLLHQVVTMYLLRMQSIKFDLSQRTGR